MLRTNRKHLTKDATWFPRDEERVQMDELVRVGDKSQLQSTTFDVSNHSVFFTWIHSIAADTAIDNSGFEPPPPPPTSRTIF